MGNNIVHHTAQIGKDCKIGPNVSIGIGCVLGDGVRVSNSVLLHRVTVRFRQLGPLCGMICIGMFFRRASGDRASLAPSALGEMWRSSAARINIKSNEHVPRKALLHISSSLHNASVMKH